MDGPLSKGLFAYHRSTAFAMTNTMRTSDGTGSGWGGTAGSWGQARPSELAEAGPGKGADVAHRCDGLPARCRPENPE
jgi:hypothetical protein